MENLCNKCNNNIFYRNKCFGKEDFPERYLANKKWHSGCWASVCYSWDVQGGLPKNRGDLIPWALAWLMYCAILKMLN